MASAKWAKTLIGRLNSNLGKYLSTNGNTDFLYKMMTTGVRQTITKTSIIGGIIFVRTSPGQPPSLARLAEPDGSAWFLIGFNFGRAAP